MIQTRAGSARYLESIEAGMSERSITTAAGPEASPSALVESLFAGAEFGLALLDAELRLVRVNAAMARINGVAVEDHPGKTMADVWPDLADVPLQAARQALETGRPVCDLRLSHGPRDDDAERSFDCSYYPVTEAGEVVGVWATVRELSEERRARTQERRLAGELAEQRVIAEEVFARAPAGMLLLWGHDLVVRAHNRKALEQLPDRGNLTGRRIGEAFPEMRALAEGVPEAVLGKGESIHFEDVPLAFGGEQALDGDRYYTFTAVPVPGMDGQAAGVLVVGQETTEAVRRRRALERELEDEHRIVTQLQVSLMPESLPSVPGTDLASGFWPAGGGHDIGGDFFDVFPIGSECWMMVIGDVCGKGAEAAALTALARYTLRAAAIQEGAEPAKLLAQLNEAVVRQRDDARFLTAVCAFLEAGGNGDGGLRVTLAVAGHPPPLRVSAGGEVLRVGGSGALIGIWGSVPDLREEVVHLGLGERLVLYTDGVVEAGAPTTELGEAGLAELLAATAGQTAAATVAAIEGAVLSSTSAAARDDVAVLVVRPDPKETGNQPPLG
jgi:serine phosphatase RsbU (regulator of sigma subunit)